MSLRLTSLIRWWLVILSCTFLYVIFRERNADSCSCVIAFGCLKARAFRRIISQRIFRARSRYSIPARADGNGFDFLSRIVANRKDELIGGVG